MEEMRNKLRPESDDQPPEEPSPEEEAETDGFAEEEPQHEGEQVEEEFVDLNHQLDQISTFLDDLEQKNDNLQDKLRELLAMSKEDRMAALADQLGLSGIEDPSQTEQS